MSGVARWRYAVGVGEGGRRGCPLTGRTGSLCQVSPVIISSLFANLIESRCIEHTVHLGAAAFVKAVGPKMKNWMKNCTASVEDANEEDDDDEEWVAD